MVLSCSLSHSSIIHKGLSKAPKYFKRSLSLILLFSQFSANKASSSRSAFKHSCCPRLCPKKERMMCFATWSLISKGIRIRFFLDVARLSWSIPESDQAAQSCVISVISWQSPVLSILVLHDQRLRSDFWSQLSLQLLPSLLLVTLQLKLETLG